MRRSFYRVVVLIALIAIVLPTDGHAQDRSPVEVNEQGTEAAAVTVGGCFPAGNPGAQRGQKT